MPDAPLALARTYLDAYRATADARLAAVLADSEARLAGLPFGAARYHAALREFTLRGGKRLRGALVVLGCEACGGDAALALGPSLSLELLHADFLAYDDFMDRDELRRGGRALHMLAGDVARAHGSRDPEHRGVSAMLLLGLVAQSLAFAELARAPLADGPRARALAYLSSLVEGVAVGQLLDVSAADFPSASAAELAEIHRRKTGLYTTEGPLVLGALVAGGVEGDARLAALRAYALPLGEAFQIVDDVLGVAGDPAETGKPDASDLREGKHTAVLEAALERLGGPRRERLVALARRPLDAAEAAEARALIESSGAIDLAKARAHALAAAARAVLDAAPLDARAKATLASLSWLVVERRS